MVRILRLRDVLSRRGRSRTQHYNDMAAGLFPKPVKLSGTGRAVGWPEHETDEVTRATIAGKDDAAIRTLVAKLETARKAAA